MYGFVSIGIGAALGAWLRWWFGMTLNHIFPTIPLGTLAANIVGGFLIWIFMAVTRNHTFIPETARPAITNRLLTIEAELGKDALFQDSNPIAEGGISVIYP